jgi:hypothetical protein
MHVRRTGINRRRRKRSIKKRASKNESKSKSEGGDKKPVVGQKGATWALARSSRRKALENRNPKSSKFHYFFEPSAGKGTDLFIIDDGCRLSHREFQPEDQSQPQRTRCISISSDSCEDEDGREYLGPGSYDPVICCDGLAAFCNPFRSASGCAKTTDALLPSRWHPSRFHSRR